MNKGFICDVVLIKEYMITVWVLWIYSSDKFKEKTHTHTLQFIGVLFPGWPLMIIVHMISQCCQWTLLQDSRQWKIFDCSLKACLQCLQMKQFIIKPIFNKQFRCWSCISICCEWSSVLLYMNRKQKNIEETEILYCLLDF